MTTVSREKQVLRPLKKSVRWLVLSLPQTNTLFSQEILATANTVKIKDPSWLYIVKESMRMHSPVGFYFYTFSSGVNGTKTSKVGVYMYFMRFLPFAFLWRTMHAVNLSPHARECWISIDWRTMLNTWYPIFMVGNFIVDYPSSDSFTAQCTTEARTIKWILGSDDTGLGWCSCQLII